VFDVSLADTALDLRHSYNLNEGLKSMVNWSKERQ
jgi:nucleoside-diphosphate-sugar epimerase